MTIEELIKAAERELALRRAVYPHRIKAGKMKPPLAEHEIQAMEEIVRFLKNARLVAGHELLKVLGANQP